MDLDPSGVSDIITLGIILSRATPSKRVQGLCQGSATIAIAPRLLVKTLPVDIGFLDFRASNDAGVGRRAHLWVGLVEPDPMMGTTTPKDITRRPTIEEI